jgi:hypothetical protein
MPSIDAYFANIILHLCLSCALYDKVKEGAVLNALDRCLFCKHNLALMLKLCAL